MSPYSAPQTWILVCDSANVKLFINRGPRDSVHQTDMAVQDIPPIGELVTDVPGRGQPSAHSVAHHAYDEPNPRNQKKELFLRNIAHVVNKHAKEFNRLIIAAPPKALHVLRETLSPQVKEKIIGEINKDLTKSDERTLPQFLKDYLNLRDPLHENWYEQPRLFGTV